MPQIKIEPEYHLTDKEITDLRDVFADEFIKLINFPTLSNIKPRDILNLPPVSPALLEVVRQQFQDAFDAGRNYEREQRDAMQIRARRTVCGEPPPGSAMSDSVALAANEEGARG